MATQRRAQIDAQHQVQISADVSPGLHPDALINHADTLVDGEAMDVGAVAYSSGRSALASLYKSQADIEVAHVACSGPHQVGRSASTGKPILAQGVKPEMAPALREAMMTNFARVAQQIDASVGTIDSSITKLQADVDAVLKPKADSALVASELAQIRDYVKNLPDDGKRMSFLHDAVFVQKDASVAHAVLHSSCWLSGLTREQQAQIRSLASEALNPRAWKQLNAAVAVRKHVSDSMSNYIGRYAKLLPPEPSTPAANSITALRG